MPGPIVHPVSNRCTSFSFHINLTNHSWNMSNRVFDLKKTHPKFSKKIWQKRVSNRLPPKSNHDQRNISTKFLSDWLSGSHFILQTTTILFINVTAVTLGLGHQKTSSTFSQTYTFFVQKLKRLWRENQKSLQRRRRTRTRQRKRTENIKKSPQIVLN